MDMLVTCKYVGKRDLNLFAKAPSCNLTQCPHIQFTIGKVPAHHCFVGYQLTEPRTASRQSSAAHRTASRPPCAVGLPVPASQPPVATRQPPPRGDGCGGASARGRHQRGRHHHESDCRVRCCESERGCDYQKHKHKCSSS